jgi:hypothetical protein
MHIAIRKSEHEEYRLDRANNRITIRKWFVADDGQMRPSQAGLAFRPELAGEFVQALLTLAKATEEGAP